GFLDEKIKETKKKAEEIGDGFNTAADKAKTATDKINGHLKGVQEEAKNTEKAVAGTIDGLVAMNEASGRGTTRSEGAGSFFYKTVDINQLRGNADSLANTLDAVEAELNAYRIKVMEIPAYDEFAKFYGEQFLAEMKAMKAKLQQELSKAQREELATSKPTQPQPTTAPVVYQAASPSPQVDKQVTITLQLPGAKDAIVRTDESGLNSLLNILEQAGLNKT
ncbi:MAG: tape measure protein, partial [Aeromonas sp.]